MLLAIEIGNTDVVFGIYQNQNWQCIFRIGTGFSEYATDYEAKLRLFFLEKNLKVSDISNIALSSVVPHKTLVLRDMAINMFGIEVLVLEPAIFKKLPIKILRPNQIGADLVCNAMYAYSLDKGFCSVVDFGTALTITTINKAGEILGVSIAPGLKTAIRSLFSNTAQLPEVPIEVPVSVLGQNTEHAIQAGVMWGYVGMVSQLLAKIEVEIGQKPYIIATGGLSGKLAAQLPQIDMLNPQATLEGLRLIHNLLTSKNLK
jgi:type III pantothenate kinase